MSQCISAKLIGLVITFMLFTLAVPARGADRPEYKKTVHDYDAPDVTLFNQDGKRVNFRSLIGQGKVVIMDFIFGTCTTICPVLSASFVNFQNRLGPESAKIQLLSISIDPEHDTPRVLKDYLKKFRARPGWDFLTGNRENIERVTHAFDAYTADKMAHFPLTFVYSPVQKRWFRIDGLVATSELMSEYQKALSR
ncbi:MAG TPA: SCO family protein [Dissulfurispiraceae bacterium]|nr:SCO family protein [Dissulfurispiraceae bacterium]